MAVLLKYRQNKIKKASRSEGVATTFTPLSWSTTLQTNGYRRSLRLYYTLNLSQKARICGII